MLYSGAKGTMTPNNLHGVPCHELTCESPSDYFRRWFEQAHICYCEAAGHDRP